MKFEDTSDFRMRGMKFAYQFTATAATSLGFLEMVRPRWAEKLFGWNKQEDIHFGIGGACYFGFGLLSMLGLKDMKKWSPILLLQFVYKTAWFIFVVARLFRNGELEFKSSWALIVGYAAFIAADLWGVPFRYLLSKESA